MRLGASWRVAFSRQTSQRKMQAVSRTDFHTPCGSPIQARCGMNKRCQNSRLVVVAAPARDSYRVTAVRVAKPARTASAFGVGGSCWCDRPKDRGGGYPSAYT